VPHIVLPPWWDCYEFAARVEYLGIGIYGSRKSKTAPECDAVELAEALQTLTDVGNPKGKQMHERAKKLAVTCNAYGGRVTAANKILEHAATNKNRKVEAAKEASEKTVNEITVGAPTKATEHRR
jgi:UDP:flavonoid glycosyltransferase YjiC (YdhE family)